MATQKGIFITENSVQNLSIVNNVVNFGSETRNVDEFWEKGLYYAMPDFCSFTLNLPDGVKYLNYTKNRIKVLVEIPPQYRNININLSRDLELMQSVYKTNNGEVKNLDIITRFNLFLPYTLFFFDICINDYVEMKIGIYMDNKPFSDIRNKVYHLPFMNLNVIINGDGDKRVEKNELCMGFNDEDYNIIDRTSSLRELIEYSLNKFWSNTFNNDYLATLNRYNNSFYNNYFEWERISKTQPDDVLTEMNKFERQVDLSKSISKINLNDFKHHEFRMFAKLLSGQYENLQINKYLENFPCNEYSSNYNRRFNLYSTKLKREFTWNIGEKIIVGEREFIIEDYIYDSFSDEDFLVLKDIKETNENSKSMRIKPKVWTTDDIEDICLKQLETEMELIDKIKVGNKYMKLEPGSIITVNYDNYQMFYKIKNIYLDRDNNYMLTLNDSNFGNIMLPLDIPNNKVIKINLDSIEYKIDNVYKLYHTDRNIVKTINVIYKGVIVNRIGQLELLFVSEGNTTRYKIVLNYNNETKILSVMDNSDYGLKCPTIKKGNYEFNFIYSFINNVVYIVGENNSFSLTEDNSWLCNSVPHTRSLLYVMNYYDINNLIKDDCLSIPLINGCISKIKKGDIIIRLNKEYEVLDFVSTNNFWELKVQSIDDKEKDPENFYLFDDYIYLVIPFEKDNKINKSVIIKKTSPVRITNLTKKDKYKIKYNIIKFKNMNPYEHYYHINILSREGANMMIDHSLVERYFDII